MEGTTMSMTRFRFLLATLATSLIPACGAATGPTPDGTEKPPGSFTIVQLPASTPIFNDSVAFYAKMDDDAEGIIYFQAPGGGRGEKFARLRIKKGSLLTRPDGSAFAAHDSVLIVMKMTSPRDCQVQLTPSGLKFTGKDPADLELEYVGVDDINGDGKVDDGDAAAERKLAIWRQETIGDPYVKIGTVKTEGAAELKAQLTGFSRYAISY